MVRKETRILPTHKPGFALCVCVCVSCPPCHILQKMSHRNEPVLVERNTYHLRPPHTPPTPDYGSEEDEEASSEIDLDMDLDERIRRSPPSRYPRTDIPECFLAPEVVIVDPLQRVHDAMRFAQEYNTPLEG